MSDSLSFDSIVPIEIPVTIGDRAYVLREATQEIAERYRAKILEHLKMNDGKLSGISGGVEEAKTLAVGMCLHEANAEDKALRRVGVKTVQSWTSRVVRALFDKLNEISILEDENEDEDALVKQQEEIAEKLEKIRGKGSVGKNSQDATMHDSE